MKFIKNILFLVIVLCVNMLSAQDSIFVDKGEIDISTIDFDKITTLKLQGEWEFYWRKLYQQSDFCSSLKPDAYIKVPGSWTGIEVNDQILPDTGFATYRLIIRTNAEHDYSILFYEVLTAYDVWLNGELLSEFGKVTDSVNKNIPNIGINSFNIHLHEGVNELIIHVSNYQHRLNSFEYPPEIGEPTKLNRRIFVDFTISFLIFSIIILIAIFNLGIYLITKEGVLSLLLALFSFVISLRILVAKNFLITQIIPTISWHTVYFIVYLAVYLSFPLLALYVKKLVEIKKFKWLFYSNYILSLLFILTLTLPTIIYTELIIYYQLYTIFFTVFLIYLLFKSLNKNRYEVLNLLGTLIILLLAFINDTLNYSDIIDTFILFPFSLALFFLVQGFILIKKLSMVYLESEKLKEKERIHNKELQILINDKTIDLNNKKEELLVQKSILEDLNKLSNKYYIVVNQMPITILITDIDYKIIFVNSLYTDKIKYSKSELIGRNPGMVRSEKVSPEIVREIYETIESGNTWSGEIVNISKDKQEIIQRTIVAPIRNNNEKIINYMAIEEDITLLKEREHEIVSKNNELETLYEELTESHDKILLNMESALQLQSSLFPDVTILDDFFHSYFIYYKAKTKIGGDFYFVQSYDNIAYVAVGDCTGHGVPGALLTILSILNIRDILSVDNNISPADLLEELRFKIKSIFSKFGTKTQDGMDISICKYDKNTNEMVFAGANTTLLIYRGDDVVEEIKGVRNPVGFYPIESSFQNVNLQMKKNDVFYLYSDGITDQFNSKYKKFSRKRFIRIIKSVSESSLANQKIVIEGKLSDWMFDVEQIDDITVMGIKIN